MSWLALLTTHLDIVSSKYTIVLQLHGNYWLPLFYIWENWGIELNDLLKVIA